MWQAMSMIIARNMDHLFLLKKLRWWGSQIPLRSAKRIRFQKIVWNEAWYMVVSRFSFFLMIKYFVWCVMHGFSPLFSILKYLHCHHFYITYMIRTPSGHPSSPTMSATINCANPVAHSNYVYVFCMWIRPLKSKMWCNKTLSRVHGAT